MILRENLNYGGCTYVVQEEQDLTCKTKSRQARDKSEDRPFFNSCPQIYSKFCTGRPRLNLSCRPGAVTIHHVLLFISHFLQSAQRYRRTRRHALPLAMLKARPRVRRSFGGKDGIWWRKKACPESAKIQEDGVSTLLPSAIGWDESLCRPIYPKIPNSSFSYQSDNDENGASENEHIDDVTDEAPEDANPAMLNSPLLISQQSDPIKRKSKCYRGFRKRPLSVFIDTDLTTSLPTEKRSRNIQKDYQMDSLASTASRQIQHSADPVESSPSENALIHMSKNRRTRNRLASVVKVLDKSADSEIFDFDATVEERARAFKKDSPSYQPSAKSSIDEARNFFNSLDSSEKLTLDGSSTPVSSSRVFRTRRGVCTSSPRLVQEYSAYVEAIESTGVAPLDITEYAKNRGELSGREDRLFDGFLEG